MTDLQWLHIALYICPMRSLSISPNYRQEDSENTGQWINQRKTDADTAVRQTEGQTNWKTGNYSKLSQNCSLITKQMFLNESTWIFYDQTVRTFVMGRGRSLINEPTHKVHNINFKANSPGTHVFTATCFVLRINKRIGRFIRDVSVFPSVDEKQKRLGHENPRHTRVPIRGHAWDAQKDQRAIHQSGIRRASHIQREWLRKRHH